jgi:cytochrome c-type biogenesis protein CcmH/NrfF
VTGVALWSIPAALIVAGIALIAFGFLVGKKMATDDTTKDLTQ